MADREIGKHLIVFGASGRRAGCRVCRKGNTLANGVDNPDWENPCKPDERALAHFEAMAREKIFDAMADLEHAAEIRKVSA